MAEVQQRLKSSMRRKTRRTWSSIHPFKMCRLVITFYYRCALQDHNHFCCLLKWRFLFAVLLIFFFLLKTLVSAPLQERGSAMGKLEPISPVSPVHMDPDLDLVPARFSKEELIQNMDRVDREITMVEQQICKLRKKQVGCNFGSFAFSAENSRLLR